MTLWQFPSVAVYMYTLPPARHQQQQIYPAAMNLSHIHIPPCHSLLQSAPPSSSPLNALMMSACS